MIWQRKTISYLKLKDVWLQILNPEDAVVAKESSTDTEKREIRAIAHLESILSEEILIMFSQQ